MLTRQGDEFKKHNKSLGLKRILIVGSPWKDFGGLDYLLFASFFQDPPFFKLQGSGN